MLVDTDECSTFQHECSGTQICLNTKGSYLCIPTTCPSSYSRSYGPAGGDQCTQQCALQSTRRCSDGARNAQTIITSVIQLPAVDKDAPIVKLRSYDLNQKPLSLTYFAFTDRQSGDSFVLDTSPRKPGVALLFARENLQRNKLHTIIAEARSYGADGSLLYITKFLIYVHVG